jgi:hypothetical protein
MQNNEDYVWYFIGIHFSAHVLITNTILLFFVRVLNDLKYVAVEA